ncbi:hypothetical protein GGF43_002952 [Coemansia sp. RSA 2618]|nr:hypothetical protein GGF43_002952 [Coemansia sp. RSA 2618]
MADGKYAPIYDVSSNESSDTEEPGQAYSTRTVSTFNSPETRAVLTPRRFRGKTIEAHSSSTGKLSTLTDTDIAVSRRPSPLSHSRNRSNSVPVRIGDYPGSNRWARSSLDSIINSDLGIEEDVLDNPAIAGERRRRSSISGPVSALGRLFGSRAAGNGGEYYQLEPMGGEPRSGRYRRQSSEPIWSRRMLVLPAIMFAAMGLLALVISTLAWARERRENPNEHVDARLFPAAVDPSQLGNGQYALRLVHTNDLHAHMLPFDAETGNDCDPQALNASAQCVGGVAYVKAVVDHMRGGTGVHDAVVVDAGDAVEGTAFDTLFAGNASIAVINALRYDAVALGNHEFDHGMDHLAHYLSKIRAPALCANLDFTRQIPALQAAVQPFAVIERHHLGVIGLLTPDTAVSSSLGVGAQITDPVAAVNSARARLAKMGINRIVVLSHLGFDADQQLATRIDPGIGLIIGGHSHTYLGNSTDETPGGAYPTWVSNAAGSDWQTAVVQAKSFGQYVGYLDLVFNDDGSLDSRLTRGAPVPVSVVAPASPVHGMPPSALMQSVIQPFVDQAEEIEGLRIGEASAEFAAPESQRDRHELALGHLVADALVWSNRHAPVSVLNTALMRGHLPLGTITRGDLLQTLPFNDVLSVVNITGAEIRAIVARTRADTNGVLSSLQYSGLRVSNDSVEIRTAVGTYDARPFADEKWQPLDNSRAYEVLMPKFIADGGDGIAGRKLESRVVTNNLRNLIELYIARFSPIAPILDQR